MSSWVVRTGGVPKDQLLSRVEEAGVLLNDAARDLFADPRFTTAAVGSSVEAVAVSVAELGLESGATFASIVEQAATKGLHLCPLELAVHLRLQLVDQPEGHLGRPATKGCAPPGSLTIASPPLSDDDETPKGFYLRRVDGALWLRGYCASLDHPWSAHDVLVFARALQPA